MAEITVKPLTALQAEALRYLLNHSWASSKALGRAMAQPGAKRGWEAGRGGKMGKELRLMGLAEHSWTFASCRLGFKISLEGIEALLTYEEELYHDK